MKQISLKLREERITLSKSSVIRHLSELRQDPDNEVQINNECTISLRPRTQSRWYKVIERLKVAISDYTRLHEAKPSFRTMQYQLIDEKLIKDGESDHKTFSDATVKARLGWVDSNGKLLFAKLDIDCFAEDDSRLVVDNYQDYLPKEPTEPRPIEDPEKYIEPYIRLLKSRVIAYDGIGSPGKRGMLGGRWYDQEEYVEVWEENEHWDPDIYQNMVDKYDVEPDDPEELDEEELQNARIRMCIRISKSFLPNWTSEYPSEMGLSEIDSDDDDNSDGDEEEE